jgi:hypothetical protein
VHKSLHDFLLANRMFRFSLLHLLCSDMKVVNSEDECRVKCKVKKNIHLKENLRSLVDFVQEFFDDGFICI